MGALCSGGEAQPTHRRGSSHPTAAATSSSNNNHTNQLRIHVSADRSADYALSDSVESSPMIVDETNSPSFASAQDPHTPRQAPKEQHLQQRSEKSSFEMAADSMPAVGHEKDAQEEFPQAKLQQPHQEQANPPALPHTAADDDGVTADQHSFAPSMKSSGSSSGSTGTAVFPSAGGGPNRSVESTNSSCSLIFREGSNTSKENSFGMSDSDDSCSSGFLRCEKQKDPPPVGAAERTHEYCDSDDSSSNDAVSAAFTAPPPKRSSKDTHNTLPAAAAAAAASAESMSSASTDSSSDDSAESINSWDGDVGSDDTDDEGSAASSNWRRSEITKALAEEVERQRKRRSTADGLKKSIFDNPHAPNMDAAPDTAGFVAAATAAAAAHHVSGSHQ